MEADVNFSVIVPSRNRPALLRNALESVLAQTHPSVEVIVVNDGSDGAFEAAYQGLAQELSGKATFVELPKTSHGHGQSYAINRGVARARGQYVCCLDDDDQWTDRNHLKRANEIIAASESPVDIYFTNQRAFLNGMPQDGPIWLEALSAQVKRPLSANNFGAYEVTPQDLMDCSGFCHLNTTMVRKELFERVGGLDETIRYECDRDFYLRIIDAARTILYLPAMTSHHNIPDPQARTAMSTVVSELEKRLYQIRVLDKAILFGTDAAIRKHARRHKGYSLKKIVVALAKEPDFEKASYYAREALLVAFSWKWLIYTAYLTFKRMTNTRDHTA